MAKSKVSTNRLDVAAAELAAIEGTTAGAVEVETTATPVASARPAPVTGLDGVAQRLAAAETTSRNGADQRAFNRVYAAGEANMKKVKSILIDPTSSPAAKIEAYQYLLDTKLSGLYPYNRGIGPWEPEGDVIRWFGFATLEIEAYRKQYPNRALPKRNWGRDTLKALVASGEITMRRGGTGYCVPTASLRTYVQAQIDKLRELLPAAPASAPVAAEKSMLPTAPEEKACLSRTAEQDALISKHITRLPDIHLDLLAAEAPSCYRCHTCNQPITDPTMANAVWVGAEELGKEMTVYFTHKIDCDLPLQEKLERNGQATKYIDLSRYLADPTYIAPESNKSMLIRHAAPEPERYQATANSILATFTPADPLTVHEHSDYANAKYKSITHKLDPGSAEEEAPIDS